MTKPGLYRWRALGLPKRGHSVEEYEDAFAGDPKVGRFAVADGASESSFAGLWAKLLVGGFVHKVARTDPGSSWLDPLRHRWAADVDGKTLPWFAEAKREQGAFATFLGISLKQTAEGAGSWHAVAVGDSCLFHVSKDTLLKAFPLTTSAEFGNQPQLLASRKANPPSLLKHERGIWQPGDRIFLMTDALAQWFLHQQERGKKPWRSLEQALAEDPDPAGWIDKLREQDGLRNDDVTLITIYS